MSEKEKREELLIIKVVDTIRSYGYNLGDMIAFSKDSVDDFATVIIDVVERYSEK